MEAVDDDPADGLGDGLLEFQGGLVVAVEIDVVEGGAGAGDGGQLAAGYDVEPEALLGEDAGQRGVDERLAGVGDLRTGARLLNSLTKERQRARMVASSEDVDGGAVFLGQVLGGAAADDQVA